MHVNEKGHGESQETPELHILGKGMFEDLDVVEAFHFVGHVDQRHQHEQGSEHGEENEFHGGFHPVGSAPNTNEKKSGDEHEFPEDVKEEKVRRGQGSDNGGFQ